MKRDMDLIKEILIELEENCNGSVYYVPNPERYQCSRETFFEHCRLISERNLAEANINRGNGYQFRRLTWDGHDFLDNARNSEVWNATKKSAGKLSFGVFRRVLEEVAVQFALKQITFG